MNGEITFDYYVPFFSKKANRWCPGVSAKVLTRNGLQEISRDAFTNTLCEEYQAGDATAKTKLPAVCWTGRTKTGKRIDAAMVPTGLVMIDIDHCEDPVKTYEEKIKPKLEECPEIMCVHITPSGKGLRVVFENSPEYDNLGDNMAAETSKLDLEQSGDYDAKVKNVGRLSFLVPEYYFLYMSERLFEEHEVFIKETTPPELFKESMEQIPDFTDEEKEKFENFEYRGTYIKDIINKYVEEKGAPGSGEKHNYYNEMVKNFRCIMDNNKRCLLYHLPMFGHSKAECWSQIVSICRVNTLSRLPKEFYFFLKDNGFYVQGKTNSAKAEEAYLLEEEEKQEKIVMPELPPVFREILKTCPPDFVVPALTALLPIMGTLTSYLRAVYPFDGREHSTSFFSVIYAPPGTGKGFVERFIDLLFEDLRLRDLVSSCRENIYLRTMRTKGANDKGPDEPHVSLRVIPPKNSEAELLQKQRDNHGYHMFTYAAEMDSWAKGVKAAGGNKDDMIRIAWDNGLYGQQFKSFNTFKGEVRLYWNVLITGTLNQVENYFKDVENGLVTRCSFSCIENQEFAEAPIWKTISKRGLETIKKFTNRCDARSYTKPAEIDPELVVQLSDDDFVKEIEWQFKFRPHQRVNMDWIMPTIRGFLKDQLKKSVLDVDRARDVFRRRVAVRGFRLALLCYGLWDKPNSRNLTTVKNFVRWFMEEDQKGIMKLFALKYNDLHDNVLPNLRQRQVFESLPDMFTRNDVYTTCMKQGIKTPVRRVIYEWRRVRAISEKSKDTYIKNNSRK